MPRDAVAITDLPANAGTAQPAGTAIAPANGGNIAAAKDTSRLLVRVTNTNASPRTVTFKAGLTNPPAARKGIGDLAVQLPATSGERLFVLESARFVKSDGSIDVDFETGMTGIVSAVRLPKGA